MWLSWLEHRPVDGKVAGSIPGQGVYLGGDGYEKAMDGCLCLTSVFLSLSLSPLSKSNKKFPQVRLKKKEYKLSF